MRRQAWIGAVVFALLGGGWAAGGEPTGCEPSCPGFLQRLAPAGGWCPYGGGLLRWWPPCCFPRCGAPDDYGRKKLPGVCWPAYPSYYSWGTPEGCCPQRGCERSNSGSH